MTGLYICHRVCHLSGNPPTLTLPLVLVLAVIRANTVLNLTAADRSAGSVTDD